MEIMETYAIERTLLLTNEEAAAVNAAITPDKQLYNLGVAYYSPIIRAMLMTPGFDFLDKWGQIELLGEHGLTQIDVLSWLTATAKECFQEEIDRHTVEKLADCLYASSILKLRFPARQLCSHGPNGPGAVCFDKESDVVLFAGRRLKLAPVGKKDHYLRTALETGKVMACGINWYVCEKTGQTCYQAKIVFKGPKPSKQPSKMTA